jgi:hypothetical protein
MSRLREDNIKMHVEWIYQALDRDKWPTVVNTARTSGFHKTRGIS